MLPLAAQPHLVAPHGITGWDWLHAGLIVAVTVGLSALIRNLTLRAFGQHSSRAAARLSARFAAYLVAAAGLVYALGALDVQIGPLIGALGIGGIALAFALQDILQNLVAGVILQVRRPIRHGDQVEVGDYSGTVLDIDLRNVLLRTYDGLDVYLPNKVVLEGAIVNYTVSPLRRLSLDVGVSYDCDLEAARRCMLDAARSVRSVATDPAPAAWVTGFGESAVGVTLLFWFEVSHESYWEVRSRVAVAVKSRLDSAGIEIPYPRQTVVLASPAGTSDGFEDSLESAGRRNGRPGSRNGGAAGRRTEGR